ncbi:cupin domain-containing protein [Mumia sp. DW29H23]|uniref:cupin domain-containing protein n=1 Tax=Mumia sp. DW29H23 TaxID=3421241 RepID=UPI003D681F24
MTEPERPQPTTPSRPPEADRYALEPHPEGGWFRQTWASPVSVTLPHGRVRPTATLIVFCLPPGESSAWHVVASDEVWIHNEGAPVVLELGGTAEQPAADDAVTRAVVGPGTAAGEALQVVVPAGTWQRTVPGDRTAVVSCLVSPGFDFADFRLA